MLARKIESKLERGGRGGRRSYGPKSSTDRFDRWRRALPLTDQWALSDCRYVLWPRPISWEGYNPPLVGVIRLGSILLSPIPRPGCLHLRLPCPLTRCRTLIECEATSREQGKEFSLLLREFKGCVSNGECIFRGMIKGGDF